MTNHLANSDWSGAWCESWHGWTDTDSLVGDVDECDCEPCLFAAFEHGLRAMRRRLAIRGEQTSEAHESVERILGHLATPVLFVHPAGEKP